LEHRHVFDEADRLTDEGIEYDPFSDITKLPGSQDHPEQSGRRIQA
jgi:hypothetical protein